MNQLQEKRNYTRHFCEGQITLLHTYRKSRRFEAGMLNFSEQGLGFFSQKPLMPGTIIMFRASVENYQHMATDADCQLHSMGLATIKWCQEGTRHGVSVHEMGAVYVMPY